MSIVWLFVKIGLLRYDEVKLITYVQEELVEKQGRLSLEEMNEIADICKISYGSTKITLAFIVGKYLGSLFWSTGLVLLVILPSMILSGGILYAMYHYLNADYLHLITQGSIPVLAALFVVKGLEYLKKSYRSLSLFQWLLIGAIAIGLFVVLELTVAIALLAMFILLLCFFKGGSLHD